MQPVVLLCLADGKLKRDGGQHAGQCVCVSGLAGINEECCCSVPVTHSMKKGQSTLYILPTRCEIKGLMLQLMGRELLKVSNWICVCVKDSLRGQKREIYCNC